MAETMYISLMNGGLGNQVFQYIFARYIEETTQTRVLIDDSYFFNQAEIINFNRTKKPSNTGDKISHNGYEMDYVFPNMTKPVFLSEYFDNDVWQYMIQQTKENKVNIAQQLLDNGFNFTVVHETPIEYTGKKLYTPANHFNSAVTKIPGNLYYYGYWINPGWLNAYKEIFIKDLTFRPITNSQNKRYEREINNCFSIGVHIRRGDFVRLGWAMPESYYFNTISLLHKKTPGATYFIFSDEIEWCKKNREELGLPKKSTVYVEGNYDYLNNYIDMQLMAMCNILVVGMSSFSYLASLLNRRPKFMPLLTRDISMVDICKIPQKRA
jgi:hypothetical protein